MVILAQGLTGSYASAVIAALFLPLVTGGDPSMGRNRRRGARGPHAGAGADRVELLDTHVRGREDQRAKEAIGA